MTITSSLNAGVSGLTANATRLASISNNIANSATYGYKRADVDFSSLVVNQRPSLYSAGGVSAQSFRNVSDQGALIGTGRSTDLAINGGGMFPVTTRIGVDAPSTEREFLMVPTGGFQPDENGLLSTNSGLYLMGWPIGDDGNAITGGRSSQTGLVPVDLNIGRFNAERTTAFNLGINLPADTAALAPGETFELPIEYFDGVGLPNGIDVTIGRNAAGSGWDFNISDNSTGTAVPVAQFEAEFDANGVLQSITPGAGTTFDALEGEIAFALPGGPVTMSTGRIGESSGLTQIGSSFQPQNIGSNGSPAGELQTVEVSEDGRVQAIYNTGIRRDLYQIPVADVSNPDGMTAVGNQAYRVSAESGDVYLWDAGDGPAGEIAGFSLMESNTDIAAELTNLIETQRAYSSNAKIVQTVDEMLQETTNLKR